MTILLDPRTDLSTAATSWWALAGEPRVPVEWIWDGDGILTASGYRRADWAWRLSFPDGEIGFARSLRACDGEFWRVESSMDVIIT